MKIMCYPNHSHKLLLIAFLFIPVQLLFAQPFDLLLKGGHVIDPQNKIDGNMDIAILNGKIAQVGGNILAANSKKVTLKPFSCKIIKN